MKYALILCVLSGARDDGPTLLAAAELAKREGALLKIIPSLPFSDAVVWADAFGANYIAASTVEELSAAHQKLRDDMAGLARRTADNLGLKFGDASGAGIVMISDRAPAWQLLTREAALADLLVIGEATMLNDGFLGGAPGEALMTIRSPVMIVRAAETLEGGVAAIAWDGSLPSGRAVRGALPLLRAAKSIVILQDPDGMTAEEKAAGDPARLVAYLASHGIAGASVQMVAGRREGPAILAAAQAAGASVLVAGAFGHSRLGEALLGGATRAFTSPASGPHLLLAH